MSCTERICLHMGMHGLPLICKSQALLDDMYRMCVYCFGIFQHIYVELTALNELVNVVHVITQWIIGKG